MAVVKNRTEIFSIRNKSPVNIRDSIRPSISVSYFLIILHKIQANQVPPALICVFAEILFWECRAFVHKFQASLSFSWRVILRNIKPSFLETTRFGGAFWDEFCQIRLNFEEPLERFRRAVWAGSSLCVWNLRQRRICAEIHESGLTVVLSLEFFFNLSFFLEIWKCLAACLPDDIDWTSCFSNFDN